MNDIRDWSALQEMLVADPLIPTETLQGRIGCPPIIIELHRYHVVCVILALAEAGQWSNSQVVPQLRRWLRSWQRQVSADFSEALFIAVGAVKTIGHGADPEPLADYIASRSLTAKERQLLADFIRMLPAAMPRGSGKARTQLVTTKNEYDLTRAVAERLKIWCQQNPTRKGHLRQRAPMDVTKRLIEEAKAANPQWAGVAVADVLRHRKAGRL